MVALSTLAQRPMGHGLFSDQMWAELLSNVILGTGQVTEAHGTDW